MGEGEHGGGGEEQVSNVGEGGGRFHGNREARIWLVRMASLRNLVSLSILQVASKSLRILYNSIDFFSVLRDHIE